MTYTWCIHFAIQEEFPSPLNHHKWTTCTGRILNWQKMNLNSHSCRQHVRTESTVSHYHCEVAPHLNFQYRHFNEQAPLKEITLALEKCPLSFLIENAIFFKHFGNPTLHREIVIVFRNSPANKRLWSRGAWFKGDIFGG